MELGVLLFVISDVKDYLVSNNFMDNNGKFTVNSLAEDVGIVSVVESSLKAHGVNIPSDVDKVIKALPLVISIFGR